MGQHEAGVSRRRFVKFGAGAAALAACGLSVSTALAEEATKSASAMVSEQASSATSGSIEWTAEADVLVLGGGGSGCAAALSAAENGASVICIESGAHLGGASMLCCGSLTTPCTKMQTDAGITDDVNTYLEDAKKLIGDEAIAHAGDDWKLFEIQASEGGKTVDWLADHGVQFNGPIPYPGHTNNRTYMLFPNAQAWPAVIEPLMETAGVQIYKSTKCVEMIKDTTGRVIGCHAQDSSTGEDRYFKGDKGVIYAACSIDNCTEWKEKAVSNALAGVSCANAATDGSGIIAMAAAGVDITEWKSPLSESMRTMGPGPDVGSTGKQKWMKYGVMDAGAILVNEEGQRYVNELDNRNNVITATEKQTDKRSWMIFDDTIAQNFQTSPDSVVASCPGIGWGTVDDFIDNGGILVADTIEELAGLIDIDADSLAATIVAWNDMCTAGADGDFKRASFGVEDAGTLNKGITTPPFYANGPLHGEILHGQVSCRIDTDFRALDVYGSPIEGLYAVGIGGHGKSPIAEVGHGGNMTWAFTSGRLCGEALATGMSATADIVSSFSSASGSAASGSKSGSAAAGSASASAAKSGSASASKSGSGAASGSAAASAAAGSYKDGTYTGTGTGMGGKINVTLEISGGKITVTDISPNNETKGIGGYEAIQDGTFKSQIEAAQSADIEGVSGASVTSAAIKKAVSEALSQAAA